MAALTARRITYAMLPMDGIYNMGPEAAMEANAVIMPKHCIPIHTSPGGYSEAIVARFIADNKLEVKPGESIGLEKDETGVRGKSEIPSEIGLVQNYPNPFNPSTTINFDVARDGFVRLLIYDNSGKAVRTLVNGRESAGRYSAVWDGKDEAHNPVASGLYICRLTADGRSLSRKLLLLR